MALSLSLGNTSKDLQKNFDLQQLLFFIFQETSSLFWQREVLQEILSL